MTTSSLCPHPVTRRFAWHACDGTLCVACCDCGQVLSGAITLDDLDQACALANARDAIDRLQRTMEVRHAV